MRRKGKLSGGSPELSVPETGDSAAPADEYADEVRFLGEARTQIEHALFIARFANWRLSVGGAIGVGALIATLYAYLTQQFGAWWWFMLHAGVFVLIGLMCLTYARSMPGPGSAEQRRWLLAWAAATALGGAATASLPWFLPAGRSEIQLSAAVILSLVLLGFVVSRGNRLIICATVLGHALMLASALALHAGQLLAAFLSLLFAAFVLVFGLRMSGAMRAVIGQRLYAQHLAAQLASEHGRQLRLRQLESALQERRRMMAEMHDGFGSALLTAQMQLASGAMTAADAAAVLRECMDDLRLMVDAQEPSAGDPGTLMGMLRYRLQRRIQGAGVRLHWHMEDFLPHGELDPARALDLLRLLQEAISNALRHSAARDLEIGLRVRGAQIEITVADNGAGFDVGGRRGRGIDGMHARARRLGAVLALHSTAGAGTRVTLLLPLLASTGATTQGEGA